MILASEEGSAQPTVPQLIDTRDFATSQSSINRISPQRHRTTISRSYLLVQESQDRQTLTPLSQEPASSYHVRLHYQSGPIFRKPHMVITKEQEGRSNSVISYKSQSSRRRSSIFSTHKEHGKANLAMVELDMPGTEIEIVYKEKSYAQTLDLSDPATQTYTCVIDGEIHQWRPLGPSRSVVELVGSEEQRIALFLYTGDNALENDVGVRRKSSLGVRHDVGELHTLVDADEGTRLHEEVLCSALAVAESRRIS